MPTIVGQAANEDNDPRRATSVYRYYDRYGVLVYVGITDRGTRRQREHNADKEWWPFVVRQEVEHYATRDEAMRRERDLIRAHRPPFNRQHNADHESFRVAYLAFASIAVDETFDQARLRLKRQLPLVPLSDEDEQVVLRTEPGDFSVASRIQNLQAVRAEGPWKGKGYVLSAEAEGPFVIIRLNRTAPRPIVGATASIRYVGQAASPIVHLHCVTVRCELAENSPNRIRHVRRRHLASPDVWLPCLADGCEGRQVALRRCVEHASDLVAGGAA